LALYLDTHVLVWLYQDGAARLTARGAEAVDTADALLVSPIVELELAYLKEIGRITSAPGTIMDALRRALELDACRLPFASIVGAAVGQVWTRDPFDRLIVAQAAHGQSPLLTADRAMLENYGQAFW
jgi:PIN domain nuclease of toxin-antitoxin system